MDFHGLGGLMQRRGMSLLELLIGLVIGTIATLVIVVGYQSTNKLTRSAAIMREQKSDLIEIGNFLQRLARSARDCNKVVVGADQGIQCRVDFSKTYSGNLTYVRFMLSGTDLLYLKDGSGTGTFVPQTIEKKYSDVTQFDICDDTDMGPGVPPTCKIEPVALSTLRSSTAALKPSRFFRYQITKKSSASGNSQGESMQIQNSFFIRNPFFSTQLFTATPLGASDDKFGVFFQW